MDVLVVGAGGRGNGMSFVARPLAQQLARDWNVRDWSACDVVYGME